MDGLEAARRRFPASSNEIERLIRQDDEFRGLCDDLAAAEAAVVAVNALAPELRAERLAECNDWISSLSLEIEHALLKGKVVPITTRPRR
jgi:hypothetical protein